MSEKSLRLFYALWPDEETRSRLQALQTYVRGRFTRPENLHLTLAFLGQQSADTLRLLKDILDRLPSCDITLPVDRLGYFKKSRIAWAGMHEAPKTLFDLQENLTQALEKAGVVFDKPGHFKPHITLARDAAAPSDMPFEAFVWQASQAALVESAQIKGVLTYRVLSCRSLRASQ